MSRVRPPSPAPDFLFSPSLLRQWTFSGRNANVGAGARYPSGKGEVCKTFMRRFDSDPRLQSFQSTADARKNLRRLTVAKSVATPRLSFRIRRFVDLGSVTSASAAANDSEPPFSKYLKSLIFRPWSFG